MEVYDMIELQNMEIEVLICFGRRIFTCSLYFAKSIQMY